MLLWRRPCGLDVGEGLPPGAFGEHPCRFIAQRPQPEKAKDVFLIVFFSVSVHVGFQVGGLARAAAMATLPVQVSYRSPLVDFC